MGREITSWEELERLVLEVGVLPFFRHDIPGFSVEDHTPPELWFSGEEGPWEWKGPVARAGSCVYGKLFRNKAAFVSLEWFPDLANYRRDGYDFDARYEDGLAAYRDKEIVDALARGGALLTRELKRACGYGGKEGKKGFDTVITRLQMQTYVNVADFAYMADAYGNLYGWGVARYTTPEAQFGAQRIRAAYARSPQASRDRLLDHLRRLLPWATEAQLVKFLG